MTAPLLSTTTLAIALLLQSGPSAPIVWRSVDQLTWDDFQGTPDTTLPWFAMTSSVLQMSPDTILEKSVVLTVIADFRPDDSWVLPDARTPELLAHESWHFNIAEYHARLLRQTIATHPAVAMKDMNRTLEGIYGPLIKKRDAMQDAYDRETNHGLRKKEQAQWQQKIQRELERLKKFADQQVVLRLK
jgi:hypothetical protein